MTEREKLIELIDDYIYGVDVNHWYSEELDEGLADHLLSNGVIVPPCKVGDKVWFLNPHYSIAMKRNAIYEAKVVRVYVEKKNVLCLALQVKNDMGTTEYGHITDFGKTVFLTKEEAKKALKERSEGK